MENVDEHEVFSSNDDDDSCYEESAKEERLEDYLELKHLEELYELFRKHRVPRDTSQDHLPEYLRIRKEIRPNGFLNLEEFKAFIRKVVGPGSSENQLDKLFIRLDTSCDGYVDWGEFCTYIMLYLKEIDYLKDKKDLPFKSDPKIRHIVQNRQQPTSRILVTENPSKIITISKEGTICVWDMHAHQEAVYKMATEEVDAMGNKKRFHVWVMDACFMKNCHKMVLSTSSRDLRFFDFASGNLKELIHLFGLPSAVNCIYYYYNPKIPNGDASLFCGDDVGTLYHIHFLNPTNSLFELPNMQERIQRVWLMDMDQQHSRAAVFTEHKNLHSEAIQSILYVPDNDCVITCSVSPNDSICIYDVSRHHVMYTFCQKRGAECFHLSRKFNLLATGSCDYLVRIWNPYVTNQPMGIMEGHHAPILSVIISEKMGVIFSYSRDCFIKSWEIKEFTCIQTIPVHVPSMDTGKLPEHMFSPMSIFQSWNQIFLAVGDYMVVYNLGKPPILTFEAEIKTHKMPLSAAIFNRTFKQILTASDDSSMISWDIETGQKSLAFGNAHDGEEITSVAFDWTDRKLISGSRNGHIKIWNFQNGQSLNNLERVDDAEITALVPLEEREELLALGWSRKILKYALEKYQNYFVKRDFDWKAGIVHNEDIISADYYEPSFLVTGSYDGEIIVWNIEMEKIDVRLRKGQMESISRTMNKTMNLPLSRRSTAVSRSSDKTVGSFNSRPNSRHRLTHKFPEGVPAPVDKLIFLKSRMHKARRGIPVLISSEAGNIKWWSISKENPQQGYFYAASQKDECVLAMTTDPDNTLLLTGDTLGMVRIWDISSYCLYPAEKEGMEMQSPPVIREWLAHNATIVSIELANLPLGNFVITASSDCTARLYSLKGEYIGIFGQKNPWSLENPKTWKHYINRRRLLRKESRKEKAESAVPVENLSNVFVTKLPPKQNDDSENQTSDQEVKTQEELEKNKDVELTQNRDLKMMQANETPRRVDFEVSNLSEPAPQTKKDYEDIAPFVYERSKSLLGMKADRDFERIKWSRHYRREHYSQVNSERALRPGTYCSAFAALSTMSFKSVKVSKQLPVVISQSNIEDTMLNKNPVSMGTASSTGDELRELDPFLNNFDELRMQCALTITDKSSKQTLPANARGNIRNK